MQIDPRQTNAQNQYNCWLLASDINSFIESRWRRRINKGRADCANAATLDTAQVSCVGKEMTVTTGMLERKWRWTGRGLVTVGLRNVQTGEELAVARGLACDWNLPGLLDKNTEGVLIGNTVQVGDDDGFSEPLSGPFFIVETTAGEDLVLLRSGETPENSRLHLPEKGRDCTIVNPWPGKVVALVRNGKPAETITGNRFTFKSAVKSAVNETIELKSE